MRSRSVSVVLAALLVGCGGSSPTRPSGPPPTTLPSIAVVDMAVSPNPIIARNASRAECSGLLYLAIGSVTVSERGGLGGNVDFINVTLRSGTTGREVGTINFGADQIIAGSAEGTNHVYGNGSLHLNNVGLCYTFAGGGREGVFTVAMQFHDDRGNQINKVVTVPVV